MIEYSKTKRTLSASHRKKIGDRHRGKVLSVATRKKISVAKRNPSALTRKHYSEMQLGKKNHFFGRHHSEDAKKRIRSKLLGKKHSKEHTDKFSAKMKGRESPWKGKHFTIEQKRKSSEWHIANPTKKFSNTKIEQKIAAELTRRNIRFKQNHGIPAIKNVDFLLTDYGVVIECDGCRYHNCLIHQPLAFVEQRQKDILQTAQLRNAGFRVYRFWEHEINESAEKLINSIQLV